MRCVGLVRTVLFSPEDLALVKGDPAERRRFLDDLLVLRTPRLAGVRADYERILRQRNTLLKTARPGPGSAARGSRPWPPSTSGTSSSPGRVRRSWPHACRSSTQLRPYVGKAYETVARGASREDAAMEYKPSFDLAGDPRGPRGGCWPRRSSRAAPTSWTAACPWSGRTATSSLLTLGNGDTRLPVRGYASHGESWSYALALKLASYDLLRAEGDDPILILDDVFAELDTERRDAARRPGRRRRAGAGHGGGRRRRPGRPGRGAVRRRRRGRRDGTPMTTDDERPETPDEEVRADDGLDLAKTISRSLASAAGRAGRPADPGHDVGSPPRHPARASGRPARRP